MGILFLATSFHQRPAEFVSTAPVIELVPASIETPPKLISASIPNPKPILEHPVVPLQTVETPQPVMIAEKKPESLKVEKKPAPPQPVETQLPTTPIETVDLPNAIALSEGAGGDVEPAAESASDPISTQPSPLMIAHPRYRENPPLAYPSTAMRRRQEGTVILLVAVNAKGKADTVDVKESSGFKSLDDAARSAVKHWQFDPARAGDQPVPSKVEVPVRFQLSK